MKTWINKKNVGAMFLVLILLLTFFSKTIYTYHLPEVTAVKPFNGQLSKIEVGYGTVRWAGVDSIYIPEEGIVGEMYVQEGEYVKAGQTLFSMEYDREENDRKLQEIANNRTRLQLELADINLRIEAAHEPDAELLKARQSAAEAAKYAEAADVLYEVGGISLMELNEAKNQASYLRLKLANLTREAEQKKEFLRLESEEKKLELEDLSLLEAPYQKTREIHNNGAVLTAKADGMLLSFHVEKGKKVEKDTLAAEVGTGSDYILECPVSLENDFIAPGDTCSLSNASHQVKGVIAGVLPGAQEKVVKILFTADGVAAGETFAVLFQKKSTTSYILVPNAAINKDDNGYYLKQIKRRDGIMGKEYYLVRSDIYIGDSDSENTAVIQGVTFFEPVLLSSDKTAVVGDVILLKNAGDFYEE